MARVFSALALAGLATTGSAIMINNDMADNKQKWDFERISGLKRAGAKIDSTEIVAFHPSTRHVFVANPQDNSVDVAIMNKDGTLSDVERIVVEAGYAPNTVYVEGDIVALAADNKNEATANGKVFFYNPRTLALVASVEAGNLPDMVAVSKDGRYAVVANEGQPVFDTPLCPLAENPTGCDPEGTVSIIDLPADLSTLSQGDVRTVDFTAFNTNGTKALPSTVLKVDPTKSWSQDLEPEYVAISDDSTTAYVALQEANAIAMVDLAAGEITKIVSLPAIDRGLVKMDWSDKDGLIGNFKTLDNVYGLSQPDGIVFFTVNGKSYIATANEGDSKDYSDFPQGFSEEARFKDLTADDVNPDSFKNWDALIADDMFGRQKVSLTRGLNADGKHDQLYVFGSRSFSILDAETGERVYDSGSMISEILAEYSPLAFNANEDDEADKRSDDKGAEPEAVVFAELDGTPYLFVGLERTGGVMMFDVTNVRAPVFHAYFNTRDFANENYDCTPVGDDIPCQYPDGTDASIEGMVVVDKEDSPTGNYLLLVTGTASATTAVYELKDTYRPTVVDDKSTGGTTININFQAGMFAQ